MGEMPFSLKLSPQKQLLSHRKHITGYKIKRNRAGDRKGDEAHEDGEDILHLQLHAARQVVLKGGVP